MIRAILVAGVLAVLSACATQQRQTVSDQSHELWTQRQQQLSTIDAWDLHGRLALYVNDEVHNLGLSWTRTQNQYIIKLEAPFNQGMMKLVSDSTSVTLTTSEGDQFRGKDAQQILRQTTGWSIPVAGLSAWILGINHKNSDYAPDIDAQGRANSIQQDEWVINYLNYTRTELSQFNNPELPQKLYMKHSNLALKIVIDQWQPPQPIPTSDIFPSFPD